MSAYRVESFGRDCLGNITGYRIVQGAGRDATFHGAFIGDIYEPGSFGRALSEANRRCGELNADGDKLRDAGLRTDTEERLAW